MLPLLVFNCLILALSLFNFKNELTSKVYYSSLTLSVLLTFGIVVGTQLAKKKNFFSPTQQKNHENSGTNSSLFYPSTFPAQQVHHFQLLIEREIWKLENIRGWISYELHEDIAQILVAAKNHLYTESHSQSSSYSHIERAGQILEEAINKVRKLYERLEVPPLQLLGLIACIQMKVDQENQNGPTKITLENNYEGVENLEESTMLIVYRVVSEKINNILKHSKAKNAIIEIEQQLEDLKIKVTDDGIGFYNSERYWKNGLYMINTMVSSLGGSFTIKSAPGRGCQCLTLIPNKITHKYKLER
jgi:signal transduction histidine kinase